MVFLMGSRKSVPKTPSCLVPVALPPYDGKRCIRSLQHMIHWSLSPCHTSQNLRLKAPNQRCTLFYILVKKKKQGAITLCYSFWVCYLDSWLTPSARLQDLRNQGPVEIHFYFIRKQSAGLGFISCIFLLPTTIPKSTLHFSTSPCCV